MEWSWTKDLIWLVLKRVISSTFTMTTGTHEKWEISLEGYFSIVEFKSFKIYINIFINLKTFNNGLEQKIFFKTHLFSTNILHSLQKNEESHTCEESGAHPRISVWHFLMNLKNNFLLQKLLKWANKKYKYLNIKHLQKFKK